MFIQVIQGKVADPERLRNAVQRWREELAPGAAGWLGTTAGVTPDGTAVAVVRFESEDAARRNGDRPEQQQWWAEASSAFAGSATFHDCAEVFTFLDGGSDDAGFVQVIQSRVADADRMRRMFEESLPALRQARPDVIGGTVALHGDGGFTQTVYFTTEDAARQGERESPPDAAPEMDEEMASIMRDATFYDLPRPWLHSAG